EGLGLHGRPAGGGHAFECGGPGRRRPGRHDAAGDDVAAGDLVLDVITVADGEGGVRPVSEIADDVGGGPAAGTATHAHPAPEVGAGDPHHVIHDSLSERPSVPALGYQRRWWGDRL